MGADRFKHGGPTLDLSGNVPIPISYDGSRIITQNICLTGNYITAMSYYYITNNQ